MSEIASFDAASEAIENSLHLLNSIDGLARRGLHPVALDSLRNGHANVFSHAQAIYDSESLLDAVAEGTPPLTFSNYHRAALQLWSWTELAIQRANVGVPKDEWEVPSDVIKNICDKHGTSPLKIAAGIRRERARVLATPPPLTESETPPSLGEVDYSVLIQLGKAKPQTVPITDLAVYVGSGRGTTSEAVRRLEELNYAHRPNGKRSGVAITANGLSALRPDDRPK